MIVAIHILPFLFISFALNHPKFPVLSYHDSYVLP